MQINITCSKHKRSKRVHSTCIWIKYTFLILASKLLGTLINLSPPKAYSSSWIYTNCLVKNKNDLFTPTRALATLLHTSIKKGCSVLASKQRRGLKLCTAPPYSVLLFIYKIVLNLYHIKPCNIRAHTCNNTCLQVSCNVHALCIVAPQAFRMLAKCTFKYCFTCTSWEHRLHGLVTCM